MHRFNGCLFGILIIRRETVGTKKRIMKKVFLLWVMVAIFFGSCCKEATIPALGGGADSERKVIIEEFTGVRCVNCPDGSAEIQNLMALHGDNLIAISIHSGDFSTPYPESKYDFRTDAGDEIAAILGAPDFFPSAVVNQKHFSGESSRQLSKQSWAGYIQSELAEAPKFNVSMVSDFDEASRALKVKVTVVPLENYASSLNLSVLLTESDIVDYQLLPSPIGKKPDYHHKHVFRRVLTAEAGGVELGSGFSKGQSVEMTFNITLPAEWNADNCNLVGFVHKNGPDFDVLQAEEIEVN